MARNFNGTSDKILMSLGAIPAAPTAITLAAIVRLQAVSQWNNIITLATSADATVFDMTVSNANELMAEPHARATVTGIGTGWQFLAISKPAGTSLTRGHRYVYSTGVWTHTNAGGTDGDPSGTVARPYLGTFATGDFLSGDIAVAAVFAAALGDAAIENLPFTLQAWLASAASALWLLDQAATAQKIKDLVGAADESTLTGTSIASASVPVFNYTDGVWLPTIVTPAGGTNATVTAVPATATAAGIAAVPKIDVPQTAAAASAAGIAPVPKLDVTALPAAATATGIPPTPTIAVPVTYALATASAPPPAVLTGKFINAVPAGATAAGVPPGITIRIAAPPALATGSAPAATPSISVLTSSALSTATGVVPLPKIAVPMTAANALAAGIAPTVTHPGGGGATVVTGRIDHTAPARGYDPSGPAAGYDHSRPSQGFDSGAPS